MTKQGYLIAKNNLKETFFTSSSSYDRPTYVALDQATKYLTVEMAESALKKLLKNGAYSARIIPLSEALDISMPDEQQDAPIDPNAPPVDPMAQATADGMVDDEDDEDSEMVAKDQSGDPDAVVDGDADPDAQEVEDEVDQLLGNDQHVTTDGQLATTDIDADPNAVADPDSDPDALQDDDTPVDPNALPDDEDDELQPEDGEEDQTQDPLAVRENMNLSIKTIPVLSVNKSDVEVNDSDCETKCKVPSEITSAVAGVKAEYAKQSKFAGNNEDHRSFALTVVSAMEELEALLKLGTVHGVKMAQLKLTSLMSPILHLIPDHVHKFIAMGGRKPTLQDLFNTKRFEKKSK